MGYYAELLRSGLAESGAGWPGGVGVAASAQPIVPVTLARLFPAAPGLWLLLPGEPPDASCRVLDPEGRTRPSRELAAALRGSGRAAVLLGGVGGTPMMLFAALLRSGAWTGFEHRDGRWRTVWLPAAFTYGLGRIAVRRLVAGAGALVRWLIPPADGRRPPHRWLSAFGQARERRAMRRFKTSGWERLPRTALGEAAPRIRRPGRLDVTLYVGSLNSGGAERQHGNLAVGLSRRGHRVRMLTTNALAGTEAHYLDLITARGIDVVQAGAYAGDGVSAADLRRRFEEPLLAMLSLEIRDRVIDLAGELLRRPTDVLHCTLDYTNVVGAAAGLAVGVPVIVLSTRNVNPSTFSFYRPWMKPWYRFLVTRPNVHFIANSRDGALDYARWLGTDPSRLDVVLNGVDLEGIGESALDGVGRVRQALGAEGSAPVVAGIFRLSWEKQPLVFLDVIEKVARHVPRLKVALVGIGPLEDAVRREVARRHLEGTVVLLGQRRDIAAVLAASDVLLLTSAYEGTPNVALEAQCLRRPVVATACGGTPEAVLDGRTGFLHGRYDVEGLAASVRRVLEDDRERAAMGERGREFVRTHFSVDRMVDETLAVYSRAAAGAAAVSSADLAAGALR